MSKPKRYEPHFVRTVITRYHELRGDYFRDSAIEKVGNEFNVPQSTVTKWINGTTRKDLWDDVRNAINADLTKPSESVGMYSSFAMDKRIANVELTKDITTEVFLSDVHWHPEATQGHDPAAYAVTLEAIKMIQPDILFFGGDIVDCYAASRYDKKPRLGTPEAFKGEIVFAKERIGELRRLLPNARFIWLMGNHEMRIPKSVYTNAPWLAEYVSDVAQWLNLSRFDVELVDDGYRIGKLRHYHGDKLAGSGRVNTAKNKFERILTNLIFGHHHKFCTWFQRDQDGSYYGAFGNGTLHWLTADYVTHPEWTQGFSVIHYAKSGNFNVDQVLIHKPGLWSKKAELLYAGHQIKVNMELAGDGIEVL